MDAVTGYDLTFSAPKSVSALWALGDADTVAQVRRAHRSAVRAALGYLETHAAWSRRGKDGVEQVPTGGFAAALFDHRTSRAGDPQLHTHVLVLNKVLCADGAWRTVDGREVFAHKKAAGAVYQAALRAELTTRLPVVFDPVSEHGQAEITGAPPELLSAWSKRTAQLMAEATPVLTDTEQALGHPLSPGQRARIVKTAVLATRPAKPGDIHADQLRDTWTGQAAALGWDGPRLLDQMATQRVLADRDTVPRQPAWQPDWQPGRPGWPAPVTAQPLTGTAVAGTAGTGTAGRLEAVMGQAVTATGRRSAIWSRADLTVAMAARLPAGAGRDAASAVALVEVLVDRALADPAFGAVPLGAPGDGVTVRASDARYASAELVAMEARIVERAVSGGFEAPARLPTQVLAGFGDGPGATLSPAQRHAAVRLVASRDLVTVMTAPAGAGKTTTLAAAVHVWSRAGLEVTALAPSARAAAELSTATGAPGVTVARWLLTQAHLDTTPPGATRHRQPGRLSRRSVLVVDEASMLSTADLDALTARAAAARAALVLVGDPAQIGAVNAAGGMFDHLTHTLAGQVVQLSELHRFTHTWEAAATLRLRDGDPSVLSVYAAHHRVHPEPSADAAADAVLHRWHTAQAGGRDALMLARSWTDVTALNTRARAAAQAAGVVHGPVLANLTAHGPSTRGHPQPRDFRAGDVLAAKRNTPHLRVGGDPVRNGDRFTVLAAAPDGGLVVADLAGRGTTTLPAGYLAAHTEYGWALTIDAAQGATTDVGIVLARPGLDREHLYVALTRGRTANHVHTAPDPDPGDAGPHRPTPTQTMAGAGRRHGPLPGQLPLPDLDTALAQLARALATSGRQYAAHTLLDPAVHAAREHTWQRHDAARAPQPPTADELRHREQLTRATTRRDQARHHVTTLTTHAEDLQAQLDALPWWSRRPRATLTGQLDQTHTQLRTAMDDTVRADTAVELATRAVTADTHRRTLDDHAERDQRHRAWADRSHRAWTDPNLTDLADQSRQHTTPAVPPARSRPDPTRGVPARDSDYGRSR